MLLLSGCVSDKKTEDILSSSLGRPLPIGLNQNKGLFKYYIAPDMGIKSSNNIMMELILIKRMFVNFMFYMKLI